MSESRSGSGDIEDRKSFSKAASASLIDVPLLIPPVSRYLSALADQLNENAKPIKRQWIKDFCQLIQQWKDNPFLFNFQAYKVYVDGLCERIGDSDEERRAIKAVKSLFLYFGFYVASDDLLNFASKKQVEEDQWPVGSGLATDAVKIIHEFRLEFNPNSFDQDALLEKIELLWRIKQVLNGSSDGENEEALGRLAERSNSKSCWWFFLGLVVFATSIAIIIATHGVAIPYLKALAELSVTGKTTALIAGIFGCEAGLGIMWWQQKRYSTAFCCFWHKMKAEREKEEPTESTSSKAAWLSSRT